MTNTEYKILEYCEKVIARLEKGIADKEVVTELGIAQTAGVIQGLARVLNIINQEETKDNIKSHMEVLQ